MGKYDGKILTPTVSKNPRKEGTHGYRSFEILLANPKGISYQSYKEAGGRNNDLTWDVDRNRVSISDDTNAVKPSAKKAKGSSKANGKKEGGAKKGTNTFSNMINFGRKTA